MQEKVKVKNAWLIRILHKIKTHLFVTPGLLKSEVIKLKTLKQNLNFKIRLHAIYATYTPREVFDLWWNTCIKAGGQSAAADLYDTYLEICQQVGERPMSINDFGRILSGFMAIPCDLNGNNTIYPLTIISKAERVPVKMQDDSAKAAKVSRSSKAGGLFGR